MDIASIFNIGNALLAAVPGQLSGKHIAGIEAQNLLVIPICNAPETPRFPMGAAPMEPICIGIAHERFGTAISCLASSSSGGTLVPCGQYMADRISAPTGTPLS
jgi:hypothetical protein